MYYYEFSLQTFAKQQGHRYISKLFSLWKSYCFTDFYISALPSPLYSNQRHQPETSLPFLSHLISKFNNNNMGLSFSLRLQPSCMISYFLKGFQYETSRPPLIYTDFKQTQMLEIWDTRISGPLWNSSSDRGPACSTYFSLEWDNFGFYTIKIWLKRAEIAK